MKLVMMLLTLGLVGIVFQNCSGFSDSELRQVINEASSSVDDGQSSYEAPPSDEVPEQPPIEIPDPSLNPVIDVADFAPPSQLKMTCEDWMRENGFIPSSSRDFGIVVVSAAGAISTHTPDRRSCAYITKTGKDSGPQVTHCTSMSRSVAIFEGPLASFEEVTPTASCVRHNGVKLTTVIR